ncbi:transposable element Tc3 transposase [Trichonephila clavipes]|nr:transposable element Tc3 transposase [Trichonephila clavipes]
MDWPAYAPELNPIEHVWDMLGRRIASRQPPATFLPELRRTLLDEWCNIPQDQIDNLILSMPRRYIKKKSYEAMFGCDLRVGQSTTPTPREVFDVVEDEQQFETELTERLNRADREA